MRWLTFARERFPLAQYVPLIVVVALAHAALLGSFTWKIALVVVGMTAFFFKLRCFDEIKDFDDDKLHKPDRPLVRGLLTHRDLYGAIALCFVVDVAAFASFGLGALCAIAVAGAYSLLMYREFFIGTWLRARLTTYAFTHTVVAGFLSVAIACALLQRAPWQLPSTAYALALATVCLFNVFELARKTWSSSEETESPSYSNVHGRGGAVTLVVSMTLLATALLSFAHVAVVALLVLIVLACVVGVVGVAYAVIDRTSVAKLYRAVAALYLVGVYVVCAVCGFAAS